jgi:Zn-dependent peptidase ImmA (M78 family)
MKRGFKKIAEDKSSEIRKELGLKPTDFLCAFKVCDYLRIPILDITRLGMDDANLKNLQGEGKSLWSAATIPLGNNEFAIVHNTLHSDARQQSNLMHEIAHILCGHETENTEKIGPLSGLMRSYNPEQEEEADWLGSTLQLPRQALISALRRNLTFDEISLAYTASIEMVSYRVNITGVKHQVWHSKRK